MSKYYAVFEIPPIVTGGDLIKGGLNNLALNRTIKTWLRVSGEVKLSYRGNYKAVPILFLETPENSDDLFFSSTDISTCATHEKAY